MTIYYVYQYLREDDTPYYIGKGKDRRAWKSHKRACGNNLKPKDNSRIQIIQDNLTEQEASNLEIELIAQYGRKDLGTGILRNLTSGGEGGDTSKSPNYKKAMAEYHANQSPERYATYGMSGKQQSAHFKETISKANSCPVSCEGTVYQSVGAAQVAYSGISIRKRIDNDKYPDFFRLRPKTKRK